MGCAPGILRCCSISSWQHISLCLSPTRPIPVTVGTSDTQMSKTEDAVTGIATLANACKRFADISQHTKAMTFGLLSTLLVFPLIHPMIMPYRISYIHSRKLTWKPQKGPIKTTVLLKGGYMGFHVSLGEYNPL